MKLKYAMPAWLAVIAVTMTAIPSNASKPCLLGYYARCSWTPVSTLICLAIAGAIVLVGRKRS